MTWKQTEGIRTTNSNIAPEWLLNELLNELLNNELLNNEHIYLNELLNEQSFTVRNTRDQE